MTDVPLVLADGIVRRDALRGQTLLQPTTFALHAGDRVAITGPSGSGKSVFLRALALLDPLDAGRIMWHGAARSSARAIPRYRRNVAYIRQRPALLDGSVEDNLRYPFELRAYRDVRFDRARAASLAAQAGRAADFLDKRASELSGGEAQITALIRVLQLAPEVLAARRTDRVARPGVVAGDRRPRACMVRCRPAAAMRRSGCPTIPRRPRA